MCRAVSCPKCGKTTWAGVRPARRPGPRQRPREPPLHLQPDHHRGSRRSVHPESVRRNLRAPPGPMKVVIVGGVAGGMSAATRLRRLDEHAEIVVFERWGHVSFANCGLPYYVGGVIEERNALLLQTPETLAARFAIDVRVGHEVTAIDREARR